MNISFQCPSCLKTLYYENGDTPFQTCHYCKGKIIVPSTVVHQVEIEDVSPTEYALQEQKELKLAEIQNELNAGRKIEAIKIFKETFGTDLVTAKDAVERMELNQKVEISKADLRDNYSNLQEGNHSTNTSKHLTKQGKPQIGKLLMILIYIAIGVAIFFWVFD